MFAAIILMLIVLVLSLYYYFWPVYLKRKEFLRKIEQFKGPKWYPIIGTTAEFIFSPKDDLYEVQQKRNEKYAPICRSYLGTMPTIHLMRAEHAEVLLNNKSNIGKPVEPIKPWLRNGLVTSDGDYWHRHRKIITPTFHFKVLDRMTEVFSQNAQKLTNELIQADGEFRDIFPLISNYSLNVICQTAMTVNIDDNQSKSEYLQAVTTATTAITVRYLKPYLLSDIVYYLTKYGREFKKSVAYLHEFSWKVIKERKQLLKKSTQCLPDDSILSEDEQFFGKKKHLAFLDLLLEQNNNGHDSFFTDTELQEEVNTFIFAGHDTSSVALSYILHAIADNPNVQEELHKELDSIYGDGDERNVTVSDINEMPYLDRVVKETLRLYPVVPTIMRRIIEDLEIEPGLIIPAGASTFLHISTLHRDPRYFPDPDRFDTDRFLPDQRAQRPNFAYLPFSAGPRNCIGQKFALRNSKVVVATIMRKYRVRALHRRDQLKFNTMIVLRPQNGIWLAFERRSTSAAATTTTSSS